MYYINAETFIYLPNSVYYRWTFLYFASHQALIGTSQRKGVLSMRDYDWHILSVLYKTNSLTQCADLLFMTQSALTKRLQTIEKELDCQLVIRSSRGIVFTPQGEYIVAKANQIIETLQEIQEYSCSYNKGEQGTLSIGVPHSCMRFLVPKLLSQYVVQHPNVRINITTALSEDLVKDVQDGMLDLCFARYTIDQTSNLETYFISNEQSYAVYSEPFTLKDLPHLPYIEFSKNESTKSTISKWWGSHFSSPHNHRFMVNNGDSCLSMIKHGLGYGIFPDQSYFSEDPHFYSLPLTFPDGRKLERSTFLVIGKSSRKKMLVSTFKDFVLSHI